MVRPKCNQDDLEFHGTLQSQETGQHVVPVEDCLDPKPKSPAQKDLYHLEALQVFLPRQDININTNLSQKIHLHCELMK